MKGKNGRQERKEMRTSEWAMQRAGTRECGVAVLFGVGTGAEGGSAFIETNRTACSSITRIVRNEMVDRRKCGEWDEPNLKSIQRVSIACSMFVQSSSICFNRAFSNEREPIE